MEKNNDGYNLMLDVYTEYLNDNSNQIINILELLQDKTLSPQDKKTLKRISKDLKRTNSNLRNIGK